MNADLIREVGLTLSALVMGFALIAAVTCRKRRGSVRCKLYVWLDLTIFSYAATTGLARAFSISKDLPLDWRDATAILLSLNALALLYITTRSKEL